MKSPSSAAPVIGQRVRVAASVRSMHAGATGVVSKQMTVSGNWKILFDGVDRRGRTLFGVFAASELEPVDDEMALFERYLDGSLSLDAWSSLANEQFPPPRERITYVRGADDWLKVVWVRVNDDETAKAA